MKDHYTKLREAMSLMKNPPLKAMATRWADMPVENLPPEILARHKTTIVKAQYQGENKYRVTLADGSMYVWVHQGHQGQPWKISKVSEIVSRRGSCSKALAARIAGQLM